MALATLCLFIVARERLGRTSQLAWAGVFLCLLLVWRSNSKTAWTFVLALTAMLPLFRALRMSVEKALPIIILSMGIMFFTALWLVDNLEIVLAGLHRDVTLTGRTQIWNALIPMIKKNFWLGYGYASFWQFIGYDPIIWQAPEFSIFNIPRPAHAHNGFIDLWLELGLVGVVLFTASLISNFVRAISLASRKRGVIDYWPLALMTYILLYNVTESLILGQNSLDWALYVAITFHLSRGRVPEEEAAPSQTQTSPAGAGPLPERMGPGGLRVRDSLPPPWRR